MEGKKINENIFHKIDINFLLNSGTRESIKIPREEEIILINKLRLNDDSFSKRLVRYYDMPDLSRKEGNPVKMITDKIKDIGMFKNFDIIEIPEIVGTYETFDLLCFPMNHPARNKSDTYYIDQDKILRTHMTVIWHYYFSQQSIKDRLEKEGEVGAFSHGKVYRKDLADKNHFPIFHQLEGLYVCSKAKQQIGKKELIDILSSIIGSLYGKEYEININDYIFPYSDLSIKAKMKFGENRLEILGASIINGDILDKLGIDSNKYNGLAFGPGIERLAMIKKSIPDVRILRSEDYRITQQWKNLDTKYEDVSKYPETYRDISFILSKDVSLNSLFEIVRDEAGDLVEEVTQLDKYENEKKFGEGNISYTFRIIYRSHEKTLLNNKINDIQFKIREELAKKGIVLR